MKNLAPAVRVSLCALALTALAVSALAADRIPITTSSEEARQLYLKGRDLVEKLRATDARPLFEQALAKDPSFALAQVGLANTAGTAKEFFAAIGQGGRALRQGLRAGAPPDLRARRRRQGRAGAAEGLPDQAHRGRARRRARAQPARRVALRPAGLRGRDRRIQEGHDHQPPVLAALQPDGLRLSLHGPVRRRRSRPSRSTSS